MEYSIFSETTFKIYMLEIALLYVHRFLAKYNMLPNMLPINISQFLYTRFISFRSVSNLISVSICI